MSEILDTLFNIISYDFARRAIMSGIFIAISASLLGVFLVLKRQALITDGLAHISFAAVAAALLLGLSPIPASLPIVILASILINYLGQKGKMGNDSAIGLLSSTSMALGIILISLSGGINIDINSYLFGSILAVTSLDLWLSLFVVVVVFVCIVVFYNELFVYIFDPDFAVASGIKQKRLDLLFVILQSVTIVVGVKIVGALLMSSLVVFPAVSALQISRRFKTLIILSVVFAVISVIAGIIISFFSRVPTGAGIVICNAIIFVLCFFMKKK